MIRAIKKKEGSFIFTEHKIQYVPAFHAGTMIKNYRNNWELGIDILVCFTLVFYMYYNMIPGDIIVPTIIDLTDTGPNATEVLEPEIKEVIVLKERTFIEEVIIQTIGAVFIAVPIIVVVMFWADLF